MHTLPALYIAVFLMLQNTVEIQILQCVCDQYKAMCVHGVLYYYYTSTVDGIL